MTNPRFYFAQGARGPTIFHDPGPNKMKFPVLYLATDIGDADAIGSSVAEILDKHWEEGE